MKLRNEPILDRILAYSAAGLIVIMILVNLWRYIAEAYGLDPGPLFTQ